MSGINCSGISRSICYGSQDVRFNFPTWKQKVPDDICEYLRKKLGEIHLLKDVLDYANMCEEFEVNEIKILD